MSGSRCQAYLRTKLGPEDVAPRESESSHHAGEEEEAGGRRPEAGREVDLEIAVRSCPRLQARERQLSYQVWKEDVCNNEGDQ